MIVAKTLGDLRRALEPLDGLGLVPTMGYLHRGHLSLVEAAKQDGGPVGVSIFVNPTQFGPSEDLAAYPRDLDRDLDLLQEAGVDVVWTPSAEEVYPPGFQTWVEVEGVSQPLEGSLRPGHFRGVATVVGKLFTAFRPRRAYFGQKDAQQVVVIRRMTLDLNFGIHIAVCPIVREPDGLAMSSRNSYLSASERQAATVLYRALGAAEAAFEAGQHEAGALRKQMGDTLDSEPLARTEYVSAADPVDLHELQGEFEDMLLSMAVFVGNTRLIDNVLLGDTPLGG